jgi:hypothetical protein
MEFQNNFNDENETEGNYLFFNQELSVRHAEGLPLVTVERMNWKTVGTSFNVFERVATENNLSDTPGNILKTDVSGVQVNNKHDSVIIEKRSKMFMF